MSQLREHISKKTIQLKNQLGEILDNSFEIVSVHSSLDFPNRKDPSLFYQNSFLTDGARGGICVVCHF